MDSIRKALRKEREAPQAQYFREKTHSADVWGLSPTNSLVAIRTVLTFIDGHTRIFIISIKYEALGCLRDLCCLGSDAARSAAQTKRIQPRGEIIVSIVSTFYQGGWSVRVSSHNGPNSRHGLKPLPSLASWGTVRTILSSCTRRNLTLLDDQPSRVNNCELRNVPRSAPAAYLSSRVFSCAYKTPACGGSPTFALS